MELNDVSEVSVSRLVSPKERVTDQIKKECGNRGINPLREEDNTTSTFYWIVGVAIGMMVFSILLKHYQHTGHFF